MTDKRTRQLRKAEVAGSRRVLLQSDGITVVEVQYLVTVQEITFHDAPVVEPEPIPVPPPVVEPAFPARTAAMIYYQHGESQEYALWESGERPPTDGSLHINVANSIDGNNDKPNSPIVGCDWQNDAMHFWWDHQYGKSAGTRAVFSRHGWKPTGLLPYKGQTIYVLLDFMAPVLPIGAPGKGLWTTWPVELKAHDAYGPATVQANVDSEGNLVWATAYPNVTVTVFEKPALTPGKVHRLKLRIDQFADPAKGRFMASLDGVAVVDIQGQMAYPSGEWAGCCTLIPCLYSNQLQARTDGYLPNLIVSTEPLP